jgi:hypothetical protein
VVPERHVADDHGAPGDIDALAQRGRAAQKAVELAVDVAHAAG